MKVLVLIPSLKGAGGVANIFKVLRLNEEDDITYMEVTPGRNRWFAIRILEILVSYFRFFVKNLFNRYDIIHSNPSLNLKSVLRDSGFQFIARLFKAKRVVFFHGWSDEFQSKINSSPTWSKFFNAGLGSADAFLVLGKVFQEKVKSILDEPKHGKFYIFTTVADGTDWSKEAISEKSKSFPNNVSFLFLSRIVKEKGIYIALDAFKMVYMKLKHLNPQFILAGDGSELPNVKTYCDKNEIPNVLFAGYVKVPQKSHFLNTSNVFLFPTFYGEGLPCTILEAMLHGMPIISRNVGGITDVVSHGINGYITDSLDPKDFADYMVALIEGPKSYIEMAEQNVKLSLENFTGERVKEKLLSIYQELAS